LYELASVRFPLNERVCVDIQPVAQTTTSKHRGQIQTNIIL